MPRRLRTSHRSLRDLDDRKSGTDASLRRRLANAEGAIYGARSAARGGRCRDAVNEIIDAGMSIGGAEDAVEERASRPDRQRFDEVFKSYATARVDVTRACVCERGGRAAGLSGTGRPSGTDHGASRARFARQRVEPASRFDPRSFRTVTSERARVVVACPKGQYAHGRCRVGMQAQEILRLKAVPARRKGR